jgi:hypothetical protein
MDLLQSKLLGYPSTVGGHQFEELIKRHGRNLSRV